MASLLQSYHTPNAAMNYVPIPAPTALMTEYSPWTAGHAMAQRQKVRDWAYPKDKEVGDILPMMTDNQTGESEWAVPGLLREFAVGATDLLTGTATGGTTPEGLLTLPASGLIASAFSKVPKGAIGMNVWQGSPAKYGPGGASDSLKYMSTGEGRGVAGQGQAYGWGRYDAEAQGVGKQYKEFLGSRTSDLSDPGNLAASMVYRTPEGTVEAGIRELKIARKAMDDYPKSYAAGEKELNEKALAYLESGNELPSQSGYLYKHDLPDEDIAKYLDWDAPLSEQPNVDKLRAAIKKIGVENGLDYERVVEKGEAFYPDLGDEATLTGKKLYGFLVDDLGSQQAASEALDAAGIPGLKYFDGNSRNIERGVKVTNPNGSTSVWADEDEARAVINDFMRYNPDSERPVMKKLYGGTRNFVTWNQGVLDRMKMLERNDETFPAMLQGGN
jgi:hypothetical protein